MDSIKQYYNINDIKYESKTYVKPLNKTSKAKIYFTLNEIQLYYDKKTGGYSQNKKIKGGYPKLINVIEFN